MKGGIGNLMKQAQEMQANLKKIQEEMVNLEVTGESGGGMVQVTMNGRHDVRGVRIAPEVMTDREMLEDLIAAATNDAVRRVESASQERMSGLTGGLNLPPGMKLPF